MKNVIITLAFLGLIIQANSQYNTQLIDSTKTWSIINEYTAGGGIPYSFFTKFIDDTIIGGMVYKKILISYDEFMTEWSLEGFIREEDSKIYQRDLNDNEGLLYDFDVEVNDTISIFNCLGFGWWTGWSVEVFVSSIDSIWIEPENKFRKRIVIKPVSGPNFLSESWIEGMGSEAGVVFSGFKIAGPTGTIYSLLCYYESENIIYQHPDHSVCFYPIVDVPETVTAKFLCEVYPDPVKGTAFICYKGDGEGAIRAVILNSMGAVVEEREFQLPGYLQIFSSDFHSGMYLYNLFRGNERVAGGKFIIQ
jgi:hypothetical protein